MSWDGLEEPGSSWALGLRESRWRGFGHGSFRDEAAGPSEVG